MWIIALELQENDTNWWQHKNTHNVHNPKRLWCQRQQKKYASLCFLRASKTKLCTGIIYHYSAAKNNGIIQPASPWPFHWTTMNSHLFIYLFVCFLKMRKSQMPTVPKIRLVSNIFKAEIRIYSYCQENIVPVQIPTIVVLATGMCMRQEVSAQDCPKSEKCQSSVLLTHTKSTLYLITLRSSNWG